MPFVWKRYLPSWLIDKIRFYKRSKKKNAIHASKMRGEGLNESSLLAGLHDAGISKGDHLMVHASLSNMGYVDGGAETVVKVLKDCVGPQGLILMPTSPIALLQYDYVRTHPVFDVLNTPSAMGKISEAFRVSDGVVRSLHPTEPVAAWGEKAMESTQDHTAKNTPYHWDSPYGKLIQYGGKILYIGVTLDNAGTHLHTLEDAVDVGVPVYASKEFTLKVKEANGTEIEVSTLVHNPEFSKKRRCDELLPMFLREGVYKEVRIGKAKTLVFDAKLMFEVMKRAFETQGVTMYNPNGNS